MMEKKKKIKWTKPKIECLNAVESSVGACEPGSGDAGCDIGTGAGVCGGGSGGAGIPCFSGADFS